jgi:hypothetical protein
MRSLALLLLAACQTTSPAPQPTPAPTPAPKATGDCARVADFFASFELGNYAEPEERDPVVAKYKDACERAMVTPEQTACVEGERDKWHAAQCVPAMVPELTAKDPQCKQIHDKLKALPNEGDEYSKHVTERTIAALWESCELDHWTPELKTCMLGIADTRSFYTCPETPEIQTRIAKMMKGWH